MAENLLVFAQLYGVSEKQAKKHILQYSEIIGYKNRLLEYPSKQAIGLLRTVQFTRSMIHDPQILLLDEPTSMMDPQNKSRVWDILDRAGKNKTILFITQDFTEVEKFADRISILHNGDIKMDGSLDKLIGVTKGLSKYEIRFKEFPSEDIMNSIGKMPRVLKPELKGNTLTFYSNQKKDFFSVLKIAIENEISDIDAGFCRLLDLYLGLIENGLE